MENKYLSLIEELKNEFHLEFDFSSSIYQISFRTINISYFSKIDRKVKFVSLVIYYNKKNETIYVQKIYDTFNEERIQINDYADLRLVYKEFMKEFLQKKALVK